MDKQKANTSGKILQKVFV